MQNEIAEFLKHHEQTIEPLSIDYASRFWDMSISGTEDNAKALAESKERYLKVYSNREEFRRLKGWRKRRVSAHKRVCPDRPSWGWILFL